MKKNIDVEDYIKDHPKWKEQIKELRSLLNSFSLAEMIKWGIPVYTLDNKNLVGIAAFKNHFSLWFYQGALLKENTALLKNAQEGKTKALRQIKFVEDSQLNPQVLRKYIEETIENHKEGKKIAIETPKEPILPEELKSELKKDTDLKDQFKNLSPGKLREYSTYISEAKREETKQKRLEKIIPLIKGGKGLYDKYK